MREACSSVEVTEVNMHVSMNQEQRLKNVLIVRFGMAKPYMLHYSCLCKYRAKPRKALEIGYDRRINSWMKRRINDENTAR